MTLSYFDAVRCEHGERGGEQFCIACLRRIGDQAQAESERLKRALGLIAELGDRCEVCEPCGAPIATHLGEDPIAGLPKFLCAEHAAAEGVTEPHEQDTAVQIALEALGLLTSKETRR